MTRIYVSLLLLSQFCTYFSLQTLWFCWRGRKNISCPRWQGTLATPLSLFVWGCSNITWSLSAYLFVMVPWLGDLIQFLDFEWDLFSLWTLTQAATCYYQSNHSKVVAIPLSALPKEKKRTCRPTFILSLF